jgi:hypothetical protein
LVFNRGTLELEKRAIIRNNRTLTSVKGVIHRTEYKIIPKQEGSEFFIQINFFFNLVVLKLYIKVPPQLVKEFKEIPCPFVTLTSCVRVFIRGNFISLSDLQFQFLCVILCISYYII